jgi:hypothetical protein
MNLGRSGLAVVFVSLALCSGCDGYDCSDKTCDGGKEYQMCLLCSSTCTGCDSECTYQTRTMDDDEIAECEYTSSATDSSGRDACFEEVTNAACGG